MHIWKAWHTFIKHVIGIRNATIAKFLWDEWLIRVLLTGYRHLGSRGGGTHAPSQFLADQLALSQIMPTNYYTPSQIFRPSDSPGELKNHPLYLVTEKIFQGFHLNITKTIFQLRWNSWLINWSLQDKWYIINQVWFDLSARK